MEYQPLQTIYSEDGEEDLRGPIGTQMYHDQKFIKTDVNNEGETLYDVPLNFSSESDEDNVPIAKRKLFERVLKGKGNETQTENERKLEKDVKARE
ncbi:Cell division protein ftsH [Cucumis melo var. makuwa]|uniref:Cell division protein ftsH n=1 Tax=Cucumis melo var. makuwa TaxID=1194695 RepID=A0A5A7UUW7_CUCMM|nr:Cell division protein ftsH [Cucumis melo var. makuwa]